VGTRSVRIRGFLLAGSPARNALVESLTSESTARFSSKTWDCRQCSLNAFAAFKNLIIVLMAISQSRHYNIKAAYSESDPDSSSSRVADFRAPAVLKVGSLGATRVLVPLTIRYLKSGKNIMIAVFACLFLLQLFLFPIHALQQNPTCTKRSAAEA